MAVSPLLSTAFTSAPRSERELHGLQHFALGSGVFARGARARVRPRPSAACCCRHSAEADRRRARRASASARRRRSGRPAGTAWRPSSFRRVLFRFARFVIRALTFAPCATSFFTSSRLVMLPGPFGRRIVVADARLADRGDRVERGVAGQVGIRIGAGVQQWPRARNGRSSPPGAARSSLPAAAGRHSRAGARLRPAWSRSRRRRPSAATRTTSVRPSRTANNNGVNPDGNAGGNRRRPRSAPPPPPRGLRPPPTSAPSVRAVLLGCRRRRRAASSAFTARACRCARRSSTPSRRREAPCSGPRRPSSSSSTIARVAVRAGQRQRRDAVAVRGFHIARRRCSSSSRDLQIVVVGRPVQRRHAIDLRRVHVDALLQQRANRRPIHLFRRIRQRRWRSSVESDRRDEQAPSRRRRPRSIPLSHERQRL